MIGSPRANVSIHCLLALGFAADMVVNGVFHCVDHGLSAEVIGDIMWDYIQSVGCPESKNDRLVVLRMNMQHFFIMQGAQPNNVGFTMDMIRRTGKGPKFNAAGAGATHLAPICQGLAHDNLPV